MKCLFFQIPALCRSKKNCSAWSRQHFFFHFLASLCPEDEHCQMANFTAHIPDTHHWPIISTQEQDPSFLTQNCADNN